VSGCLRIHCTGKGALPGAWLRRIVRWATDCTRRAGVQARNFHTQTRSLCEADITRFSRVLSQVRHLGCVLCCEGRFEPRLVDHGVQRHRSINSLRLPVVASVVRSARHQARTAKVQEPLPRKVRTRRKQCNSSPGARDLRKPQVPSRLGRCCALGCSRRHEQCRRTFRDPSTLPEIFRLAHSACYPECRGILKSKPPSRLNVCERRAASRVRCSMPRAKPCT
jgi:hypothetical protein